MVDQVKRTDYASVNGLRIYYEIHGVGRPLLLIHGGLMVIDDLQPLLSLLATSRQVIAVELEGHGRTADLDRPLSREQMADDVAGLLEQLGIGQADVFGFSLGGMVALRIAIHYPSLVRRLVIVSSVYGNDGFYPSTTAGWASLSPLSFAGTPMEQSYLRLSPHPTHWSLFIDKLKQALIDFPGWSAAAVRSIQAPTLVVLGDADLVRPEYAVEMFRLLGGARPDGGMAGVPDSQMAIIPGATHFTILNRTDVLLPIVVPFLDAPVD